MLRETCDLSSPAVAMVHRGERVILLKEAVAPGAKVEISMDFMMKTMNHWVDFRENLQETIDFLMKYRIFR